MKLDVINAISDGKNKRVILFPENKADQEFIRLLYKLDLIYSHNGGNIHDSSDYIQSAHVVMEIT